MIPWAKPSFGGREKEYAVAALDSTWISGGEFVDRFEQNLAALHGVKHAISTSNGTTALQLALMRSAIGPGYKVIVPAFGFMAPANMTIALGARPIFVDVDPETWCMSPAAVAHAPLAQAIVAVHTYGNVCDLAALRRLADQGADLIEDVAEAAFSRYNGKFAGTIGDFGCFSFQATKTITTGEGGAVLTSNNEDAASMRRIRSHGVHDRRYWHEVIGHNFRLTNLQAAVGCAQLERLDEVMRKRAHVYETYAARLHTMSGVTMQKWTEGAEPVVWAITIKLDVTAFKHDRDGVMAALADVGIETRPGFYAASQMPLYRRYIDKPLLVAESVAKSTVSLPSFPDLTDGEIHQVCDELEKLRR